jgi:hypothetical protein
MFSGAPSSGAAEGRRLLTPASEIWEEQITLLKDWLSARIAWIGSEWN